MQPSRAAYAAFRTPVFARIALDELGEVAEAVEMFRMAAVDRAETDARAAAEQQIITSKLRDSLAALTDGDLTTEITADFPPA